MMEKTMSEVGVDFSYDQDSSEQKHTHLGTSLLENLPPKQAECTVPTCNPEPTSPLNSSAWGSDNDAYISLVKPKTFYVGLVNQAMTCYLNSLLQALYMTPEFRNALYNWEYANGSEKDEANSIPYQLQKLFLNLQTSKKSAVETTALTKSFGWDSTEAWQQHDIQELCRVMFDALEQKFKNTEQADLINRLYEGKMIDYVKCLECSTEKSREDTFLDIPLPVRPFGSNVAYNSVEDALRAFVQYEILEGNNQYYCEKCNKKCDAHKGLKFTKFPYLLTFHLKRFDFDFKTLHRIKLNDKVTFPDILNLNAFILSMSNQDSPSSDENIGLAKCDDSSTADSGTLDDDYPLCENNLPNSNHSTNYDQDDDDQDESIGMSNGQSTSNCAAHNYENEKNRNDNAAKGPYNYELFSIMIHSGSASGGHYYAYIKDFRTGEWLCFNDQSVTSITHDDIQKSYGGGPTRSYYKGAYSSTNAYMLMYRQIDPERNALPMQVEDFPKHIQELLAKMKEERKELMQIIEKAIDERYLNSREERNREFLPKRRSRSLTITVFCNHPTENKKISSRLTARSDDTLEEIMEQCYYSIFSLEDVVSLEQCRLTDYDHISDTIICSYEGKEKEMCRNVFSKRYITLLLEICDKDKKFESYQGDIITKVNVVNEHEKKLIQRIHVRALSTQTVKEYKQTVGKIVNMDPDEMKMFVILREQRTSIDDDFAELQFVGITNGVNVYIPVMCDTECKSFSHLPICEIIQNFENIATVYVDLADTNSAISETGDLETWEEMNIPSPDEKYKDKEKPVVDSPPKTSEKESQCDASLKCNEVPKNGKCTEVAPARNISPQLGEGEEWNTSEQSNSEDSSLSDSDKTLVGDASVDDFQVAYRHTLNQIELENSDDDDDADNSEYYFKIRQYSKKQLQVQVDKRMKFDTFKKNLQPYVGVPADCFEIYCVFDDNDESRQFLLTSYISFEDGQRFQIRLNSGLRSNEITLKLYHLFIDSSDFTYKYICEWTISEVMNIGEAKKELLADLKRRFNIDIPYEKCRLRKKAFPTPVKVLLNDHKFGNILAFGNKTQLCIQELPDVEQVTDTDQVIVFVRRWLPSEMNLGPIQEIVVDGKSVWELRIKISSMSDIPEESLDIAKVKRYYNLSVLQIQNEAGWDEGFETKFDIKDGSVFLYRDTRETLAQVSIKKFHSTGYSAVREVSSLFPYSAPPPSYTRKEKALRIQLATE